MHTLTYEKLQNIYPEMHSFLKVEKLLDEAEVFSNPYTEKLFMIMADKSTCQLLAMSHFLFD